MTIILKTIRAQMPFLARWLTGLIVGGIVYALSTYLNVNLPEEKLATLSAFVSMAVTGLMGEAWAWLQTRKISDLRRQISELISAGDTEEEEDLSAQPSDEPKAP